MPVKGHASEVVKLGGGASFTIAELMSAIDRVPGIKGVQFAIPIKEHVEGAGVPWIGIALMVGANARDHKVNYGGGQGPADIWPCPYGRGRPRL